MRRHDAKLLPVLVALVATSSLTVSRGALADPPPAPAPAAAPAAAAPVPLATPEQAAAALAKFKEDYKAKGLKGDDRLTQKDFALSALAKVQHPTVVDALADVSRESDPMLKMLGVIYLGYQRALPGSAGAKAVAATPHGGDQAALQMSCLQTVGALKYLGARAEIRDALKSQSFAVKKTALKTVAQTQDIRLLEDVLQIVGVKLPEDNGSGANASPQDSKSGGKEVTEGYSWAGAEASVDTGTSGDGDQKAAEAQAKAQAAANEAAARGNASGPGSGGGAGGGSDGGGKGRGGGGRSTNELLPQVLGVLQALTGRTFSGPSDFKKWFAENRETVREKSKGLDETERKQKTDAADAAKVAAAGAKVAPAPGK